MTCVCRLYGSGMWDELEVFGSEGERGGGRGREGGGEGLLRAAHNYSSGLGYGVS